MKKSSSSLISLSMNSGLVFGTEDSLSWIPTMSVGRATGRNCVRVMMREPGTGTGRIPRGRCRRVLQIFLLLGMHRE